MSESFWSMALAACAAVGFGVSVPAQAASGPDAALRVGIAQLPAPSVPGAKVRTPVRLETVVIPAGTDGMQPREVSGDQAADQVQGGALDAWVGALPTQSPLPAGVERASLGWSASPMAIMRSDTHVAAWGELKDRTVCLAADGRYGGELAARFGAIEQVYPSATDALLALRTGRCDATVQDEGFLRELLKFPEWHKFSATLEPYRHQDLVRLVRSGLPPPQRLALNRMTGIATLRAAAKQQARDIAFEVYLDQTVPDCH